MTTEQMIRGLQDIEQRNIPTECIYDMSPEIADKLTRLKHLEDNILKAEGCSPIHKKRTFYNLLNYLTNDATT